MSLVVATGSRSSHKFWMISSLRCKSQDGHFVKLYVVFVCFCHTCPTRSPLSRSFHSIPSASVWACWSGWSCQSPWWSRCSQRWGSRSVRKQRWCCNPSSTRSWSNISPTFPQGGSSGPPVCPPPWLCHKPERNHKGTIGEEEGTFLMSIAFSKTPLSSMNSRVTPLEMSSPAIVSMAVQCLRERSWRN